MQEEIIAHVLSGKDTLALLPTGGGKSVCFQVPALLMDGVCLVISPLIALMRDQVHNLEEKGIAAAAIYSGLSHQDVRTILQRTAGGAYKFLYVSPERLESTLFNEWLPALNISLVAVDEAHCISQWGYDFRPPYLRIASLRNYLYDVPFIALTASATTQVQQDIVQKLHFTEYQLFRQSFARPALSYSCLHTASKAHQLSLMLKKVPGCSIVYCNSRKQTRAISELLQLEGISSHYYHAGLSNEERQEKQADWISGKVRVMVSTNAFGMGIDKPDVRLVVHYNMPDCVENYYQEAGRAGRDGQKAYAVLLYQQGDLEQARALPDIRFPAIPVIQHVYQSLADYFQLPVGSGEGAYFDFDLQTFCKSFQLDVQTAIYALKVLEQEGHISVAESIYLPAQVQFTIDKEGLYDFEAAHPDLSPLIRSLLRTYEGIFNDRTGIFENQLGFINRLKREEVIRQLERLQAFGIIEYLPRKDSPQIHYLLNRAPAKFLYIDQDQYLERKELYTQRVNDMIGYVTSTAGCRSRYIGQYFGDTALQDCGICDHCIALKRKELSTSDLKVMTERIRALLKQGPIHVDILIGHLHPHSKDRIWIALNYLQQESMLAISENGAVTLLG